MYEIIFIIIYIGIILSILYQDLESKYIHMISFYIFVISSGIYYIFHFQNIWGLFPIIIYFFVLITLDFKEYISGIIPLIWEKWKWGETGIYDYFLYIFIADLIISHIFFTFESMSFLLDFFIVALISFLWGMSLLFLHQKKVQYMIETYAIEDEDTLDKLLYDNTLKNISWKKSIAHISCFSDIQKQLFLQYKKRVPLFIFGNLFILAFIWVSI